MRYLALLFIVVSITATASEPWQQWRVNASSHPQQWLTTTEQWIEQYDADRRYGKLAMAYAIRAEALRYAGNEANVQATVQEGLRFAELAENPTAKSLLRINQAWYFLQRGRLSRAASSAVYAIEAAKDSANANLIVETEILQAQVFHESGDVARALETLEALEAEQYTDLPRLQMEFHALIGAIYLEVGALDIAAEHIRQARDISAASLGDWDTSVMEYNLARVFSKQQRYALAKQHFTRALQISRSIDDDLGVAYGLYRLAEIEQQRGQLDVALQRMQEALPVFIAAGSHPMEAQTRLSISQLHLSNGDADSALQALQAAQSVVNTLDEPRLNQQLQQHWSRYFQQQQQFEQALSAYQQSVSYLQQYQAALQDKQIQEIMVRLEMREQEANNQLLQKENELQQLQLQEQQTSNYLMLWLLISGAIIFLLISYFLYQQMRARKRYAELALKDDLTGAPNRRAIVRFCKQGLTEMKHNQRPLALGIIDFDYFKQINDSYGHDVGDHVLQRFAKVTESCLRSSDQFGRMGGEEWLLVLWDANEQDAKLIFQRLMEGINAEPIAGLPSDYRVTFSMGFTAARAGDDFEHLYKRADDVLYSAKDQGRERLQVAP